MGPCRCPARAPLRGLAKKNASLRARRSLFGPEAYRLELRRQLIVERAVRVDGVVDQPQFIEREVLEAARQQVADLLCR